MDSNTTLSGLPAFKFVYTYSIYNVPFKSMIVGAMLDDLYIFRYGTALEKFDTYLPTVMNMIKSFDIGLE